MEKLARLPNRGCQTKSETRTSLEPDPILQISKIIGFDASTSASTMRWSRDSHYLVYASRAVVVCQHVSSRRQVCLVGHAEPVSCVAVAVSSGGVGGSGNDAGGRVMIASGQSGAFALVRLWHMHTQKCLTIFRAHDHSLGMLEFSACGRYLCGVGRDKQSKTMLVVWDVSGVGKNVAKG